jgi:hypothetical protein
MGLKEAFCGPTDSRRKPFQTNGLSEILEILIRPMIFYVGISGAALGGAVAVKTDECGT